MEKLSINYDNLIGRPYRDHGRGPGAFDCYGLVMEISRRLGRPLPDYEDICRTAGRVTTGIVERLRPHFRRVEHSQIGDLAVILTDPDGGHVAIVIGTGRFIQCTRSHGVETVSFNHPFYKNRIEGFYRYHGK